MTAPNDGGPAFPRQPVPRTIGEIQEDQREWVRHNFGDRPAWHPLLGVQEEVGELAHAFLKREQGIRGTKQEHDEAIRDAVADIVIFLMDFCSASGIDLEAQVAATWEQVRLRDWRKDPAGGRGEIEALRAELADLAGGKS